MLVETGGPHSYLPPVYDAFDAVGPGSTGFDSREAATFHTGQKQKWCKETPTTGDDDELVSD